LLTNGYIKAATTVLQVELFLGNVTKHKQTYNMQKQHIP